MAEKNLEYLKGKTVLVTGGTGTFGRAFVSKLLGESEVKKLIIFSRDEYKQSEMQRDLADHKDRLRFFIGDVRDLSRLERAFEGVDIVVHAAALKQVPAIEFNPIEAIKTNILGSQNVIEAALNKNVGTAILVSSDKAVQPINLYGATKLAAEKLFVAANVYPGETRRTKFSVVRYGNVIGSRGSFVETLEKQKRSGVVTLTDHRMTRFWISIDRVMDIILGAIGNVEGGEIFVPKMRSMKVSDVVTFLAPECKVAITGIRPGEKLHEILITEHEAPRTRDIGAAFAIYPEFGSVVSWLEGKEMVPENFSYASNGAGFLVSADKAKEILL